MKYIILVLMLNSAFLHAATEFQSTKEVTCSVLNSICLDGNLSFSSSSGKINYNGEVKRANRAGEVRVIFSGKSNLNGDSTFIMRSIRFKVSGIKSHQERGSGLAFCLERTT